MLVILHIGPDTNWKRNHAQTATYPATPRPGRRCLIIFPWLELSWAECESLFKYNITHWAIIFLAARLTCLQIDFTWLASVSQSHHTHWEHPPGWHLCKVRAWYPLDPRVDTSELGLASQSNDFCSCKYLPPVISNWERLKRVESLSVANEDVLELEWLELLPTTENLSELGLRTEAGQWRVMKTQLYPIKREVRVTCPAPLWLSVALSPLSPTSLSESE